MNWFVAFHPKEPRQWWARRFGHVSLVGHKDATWVHVDLGRKHTSILPMHRHDDVSDYLAYLCETSVVLRFGPAQDPGGSFWHPMTCVSFAKQVLGVRSRALRPDGLFTILIREHGAEIVNENAQRPEARGNARTEGSAPAV